MTGLRLAAALLVLSLPASAQTLIQGELVAPDGSPHAGVEVTVNAFDQEEVATTTDRDGRFEIVAVAPGALGVRVQGSSDWLPLLVDGSEQTVSLRLTLRADGTARQAFDGFAAESSDPELARLLNVYGEAENWHRTEFQTPEYEAATEAAEALLATTPLDRQDAVRDSMGAIIEGHYERAMAPRAAAYDDGARTDDTPLVRAARAVWRLDKVHADSAAAAAVLRDVPPLSPVWAYEGLYRSGVNNILFQTARHTAPLGGAVPPEVESYLRTLAYEYPGEPVRAQASGVLAGLLEAQDPERAATERDRILREFPDSFQAESVQRRYGTDRRVQPGRPLPDFAYPSLADSTKLVTKADLAGSTVLLDFWGTWCSPCVAGLPQLTDMHERYRDQGFEVVSIAINDTAEDVVAFRNERFPMPWQHAIHPVRGTVDAGKELEFTGVPTYILVDPDGIVVLEQTSLDDVEAALAERFDASGD